jgi:hypothetical protein
LTREDTGHRFGAKPEGRDYPMEGTVKRAFGLMLSLLTPEAGESPRNVSVPRYDRPMSAAPSEPAPQYPHVKLGGEDAVIIPLAKLRHLEAIKRHAPAEAIAEAAAEEAEAVAGQARADREADRIWAEKTRNADHAKVARMIAHAEAQAAALPAPYNR